MKGGPLERCSPLFCPPTSRRTDGAGFRNDRPRPHRTVHDGKCNRQGPHLRRVPAPGSAITGAWGTAATIPAKHGAGTRARVGLHPGRHRTSFSGWIFIAHAGLVYRNGFLYACASLYAVAYGLQMWRGRSERRKRRFGIGGSALDVTCVTR